MGAFLLALSKTSFFYAELFRKSLRCNEECKDEADNYRFMIDLGAKFDRRFFRNFWAEECSRLLLVRPCFNAEFCNIGFCAECSSRGGVLTGLWRCESKVPPFKFGLIEKLKFSLRPDDCPEAEFLRACLTFVFTIIFWEGCLTR